MGIDISAYRAAVGIFYIVTHRRIAFPKYYMNLPLLAYCARTVFVILFLRKFMKNDEYLVYKAVLMLACMHIELNPGPNESDIKSVEIFHLNTRSIRNKIEYMNDTADNFHILCFSETHLDNNIDSVSMQFHGFDLPIRKDRSHNGGGVMIYMSSP